VNSSLWAGAAVLTLIGVGALLWWWVSHQFVRPSRPTEASQVRNRAADPFGEYTPEIRMRLEALTDEAKTAITALRERMQSQLRWETFAALCVATSYVGGIEIANVADVVFADTMDSLDRVRLVTSVEQLVDVRIPDQAADSLLTFPHLVNYVESASASTTTS
jgi:acyl carrier protein